MARRSPGEGSLFHRLDGRWVGQTIVGRTEAGKPRKRTVYGRTRGEALRRLQKAQREAGSAPVDRKITLAQLTALWLASRKSRLRASTWANYEGVLTRYSGHLWRVPVANITTAAIEQRLAELRAKGMGGRIVQYYRELLRRVLRYAIRRGILQASPADQVETQPHRRTIPAPWEPGEAAAFLREAMGRRLYPLFHLALATGLRIGELLGLQWEDVRLVEGTLAVKRARSRMPGGPALIEPKTSRSNRTLALDPETLAVLEARWIQREEEKAVAESFGLWWGGDYVFASSNGRPISHTWVRESMESVAAAAGVRHVRIHDLRHTYATLALKAGVPVHVVAERLGHAKVSTTLDIYAGVIQEQRAGAALSLDQLLGREAVTKQHSPAPS